MFPIIIHSCVSALPNTTVPLKPGEKDKPPRIVSHLQSDFVKDGDPVVLSVRIIGMIRIYFW